jgi:hypothetical protein
MVDVSKPPTRALSVLDSPSAELESDLGTQVGSLPTPLTNSLPKQHTDSPSFLRQYASATDQSLVRLRRYPNSLKPYGLHFLSNRV